MVSPNPVPAYSAFQITGCGYAPSTGVQFNLYSTGGTSVWGGMADSNGCLTDSTAAGRMGPGARSSMCLAGSVTVVASETFTVQ